MYLKQSQIDTIRWHLDPDWPVTPDQDVDADVLVANLLRALERAWAEQDEAEKRIEAARRALSGEFVVSSRTEPEEPR